MQKTLPKQPIGLWQALKDLDFLSAFFSWFFMLLTRLSEPLMLLATLYVVAETGVPIIALPALHNLSVGIMITAPEIILPGAFVVASRAKEHARWLYTVCWTFIVLTFITLISLFVWHFAGQTLAWLMCARCAAAVGYSILMRVMNHGKKVDQVQTISAPDIHAQFATLSEQITRKLNDIHGTFSTRISTVEKAIVQQNSTSKSVPVGEQFGHFDVPPKGGELFPETPWELVEYGAVFLPQEETKERNEKGANGTLPKETLGNNKQVQTVPENVPQQSVPSRSPGQATMTLEEAAEELGYSVKWVRTLRDEGKLRKSPRNPQRLTTESIKKWKDDHPKREQKDDKPVLRIVNNS